MKTLRIFILLLCTCIQGLMAQYPTAGLRAYYPFDGNYNDFSGNGKNLIAPVNQPTYANDQNGMAAGSVSIAANQYLRCLDTGLLAPGSFTVAYWSTATAFMANDYPTVFEFNENLYGRFYRNASATYSQIGQYNNAVQNYQHQYTTPNLSQLWIHYCIVFNDTTNTVKVYQNNFPVATFTNITFNLTKVSPTGLYVGTGSNGGTIQSIKTLNGYIDDLFFYNRTLDSVERISLMNPPTCNPVFSNLPPATQTICNGTGTVNLNVTVANLTGITYQWKKDGINLTNNANYSGVNSSSLTISNFNSNLVGSYQLSATNNCGTTVSGVFDIAASSLTGLRAWYKMDTTDRDSSGLANHGTKNNTLAAANRFNETNKALSFNGSSSFMSIPTILADTNFRNKTFSLWFKRDLSVANPSGQIILHSNDNIGAYHMPLLFIGNDNIVKGVGIGAGGWSTGVAIADTNWHHVVITTNATQLQVYLDGTLRVNGTCNISLGTIVNLTLGRGYMNYNLVGLSATGYRHFAGKIDDVRFGNAYSTAATINMLRNAEPGIISNPVNQNGCNGGFDTFNITALGNVNYQWKRNNINIAGATASSYIHSPIQPTDIGASFTCVITDKCTGESKTSNAATFTAMPSATVNSGPISQNVCVGSAITNINSSFSNCSNYSLKKNGIIRYYATNPNFIIPNITFADSGTYTVTGYGICDSATTAGALIRVIPNTAFDTVPQPAAFCKGSTAILKSHAVGGNLHYQWMKNSVNLPNDTFAYLTIPNVQTTHAGLYSVQVNGQCGSPNFAISAQVNLTIHDSAKITGQPTDTLSVCQGGFANFNITATGSAITYQWYKGWNPLGTNANNVTISPVALSDTGYYRCVVTGTCGKDTTKLTKGRLNVLEATSILTQPVNVVACQDSTIRFIVKSKGANVQNKWYKTSAPSTILYVGDTFVISNVQPAHAGNYYATASGSCGNANSTTVSLTVNAKPNITAHPSSSTICQGAAASFSIAATGANLTYRWYKNGTALNGTGFNTPTYSIATSNISDTGSYYCVVSNGSCSGVASNAAQLNLNPKPTITTEPQPAITACSGSAININLVSTATGLTYRWYKGTTLVSTQTTAPYVITNSNTTHSGVYKCMVSNACGADTSTTCNLTVNNGPSINAQPLSQSKCVGASMTMSVNVSGTGLTYQWKKNNTILPGDTLASINKSNLSMSDSGSYVCEITSGCGILYSQAGVLTVNANPTISITPANAKVCTGSSITLIASGATSYQWSNSVNNASNTVSPTSNTNYTLTAVSAASCTTVVNKSVTVNSLPNANIIATKTTICFGELDTLTATGGGTYAWSGGLGSNAKIIVSPTSNTSYACTVTDSNNCVNNANINITVSKVTAAISGPSVTCNGTPVNLIASGGTGYVWSNSLGTNAMVQVNPSTQTTYRVTVTNALNCSDTASKTISVQSQPTAAISGSTSTCSGEPVQLTATGGNTYQWSDGLGTNAIVNPAPTTTTTYQVTVSLGGTCTATASHTISVKAISQKSLNKEICKGSSFDFNGDLINTAGTYTDTMTAANGCDSIITLTLTVFQVNKTVTKTSTQLLAVNTNGTYQWLDCNDNKNPLTGKTAAAFSPASSGNYAVAIEENSCRDTSDCIAFSKTSNILPISEGGIEIYPNPSSDFIHIKHAVAMTSIVVKSLDGKEVVSSTEQTISIENIPNGIYLLEITTPQNIYTHKIMKR